MSQPTNSGFKKGAPRMPEGLADMRHVYKNEAPKKKGEENFVRRQLRALMEANYPKFLERMDRLEREYRLRVEAYRQKGVVAQDARAQMVEALIDSLLAELGNGADDVAGTVSGGGGEVSGERAGGGPLPDRPPGEDAPDDGGVQPALGWATDYPD